MQNLFKLIYFYLKIDKFLAFVTGFYRSVSPAAAPQLFWQELLSFIFGSTYQCRFYPGMARVVSSKRKGLGKIEDNTNDLN